MPSDLSGAVHQQSAGQVAVPAGRLGSVEPATSGPGNSVEAGLDALNTTSTAPSRRTPVHVLTHSVLPPVIFLAVLVGVWELVYLAELKPSYALPGPAAVANTFWGTVTSGQAAEAIWTSVSRGGVGFAMSLVIGTLLGLAMWASTWLRAAIGPIVSGLQSLPSVAWVPAAIIWFQLTDAAIYTVVLLGAVPSIANGLLTGFKQVPPLFDQVGRVLGLSGPSRIRLVLLPAALPGYLGGLRQGWAFAWRSLMAAELITYSPSLGQGLGQLLNIGRELSQMSLVITSIALILLVGVAIELLVFAPLERRVLRNRGLTTNR
jgi:NitT/TauT family transport system permease protein